MVQKHSLYSLDASQSSESMKNMIISVFVDSIFITKEIVIKLLVLRTCILFIHLLFRRRGLLLVQRAMCCTGKRKVQKQFLFCFFFFWSSTRGRFPVSLRRVLHVDGLQRVLKLQIMNNVLCLGTFFFLLWAKTPEFLSDFQNDSKIVEGHWVRRYWNNWVWDYGCLD